MQIIAGGYNYSTGDLNTISANTTGFADGGPDHASRVEYHRFVAEQAINRGFSFAAWDSGPKSNKTIHKRTDSPATLNYNINDFSVTSYEPKDTTISTVVDNSIWVEDVKRCFIRVQEHGRYDTVLAQILLFLIQISSVVVIVIWDWNLTGNHQAQLHSISDSGTLQTLHNQARYVRQK